MPPMSGIPPPGIPPAPSFSGISATIASVVRMFLAIDAAFCSADRVTIAGSITPAATRSSISPLAALRPWPSLALRMCSTTTEPSRPEFAAIWRTGSSSARRTMRELGVLEFEAHLLGDDLAAGEDRDVLQHPLAAVAEPGRLDRHAGERAAQLVHHQGCEGLALDVLGDDQQRLARLDDLLEYRQ